MTNAFAVEEAPPLVSAKQLGLALGISQTLSWGTSFYLPAVIASPAAVALQTGNVTVLGAFSWALLVTGFCAPRVGRWIDRHGGRGALAVSIITLALGQIALAASSHLAIWYLGWTIMGVGMALGLYDAAFATAGTLLGEQATKTITGITLLAGFASTLFWSLGAALIGTVGWRGLLICYATLMLTVNLPLVWWLVPPGAGARRRMTTNTEPGMPAVDRLALACLAAFFTIRWFLTSAIAVNILILLRGTGLGASAAVVVAGLIGPGQVLGRLAEWSVGNRLGLPARARLGALLFPAGTAVLLLGGPVAAGIFALLYGMSNGILTINRGTLPLALFGARGYATLLGWLAVPVLLAQATAPTFAAPVIAIVPVRELLILAGGIAALAVVLLLPLRIPGRS